MKHSTKKKLHKSVIKKILANIVSDKKISISLIVKDSNTKAYYVVLPNDVKTRDDFIVPIKLKHIGKTIKVDESDSMDRLDFIADNGYICSNWEELTRLDGLLFREEK